MRFHRRDASRQHLNEAGFIRPSVIELHHIQLAMPEGEEVKAVEFYEGILGIPQVPKPSHLVGRGGCWFESGSVRLHLGVETDFRPARKAHPAFLINDLFSMRERLVEADVPVVDAEPLPGFMRFYAFDPFGNRLEFLETV
ncbi:MAG: VOC family protein [Acidimicrobiia bacterium]